MINRTDGHIILTDFDGLNVESTLDCGQMFRFNKVSDTHFEVFSADKYASVTINGNTIDIATDHVDYFYSYFDLDTDYAIVRDRLSAKSPFLKEVCDYGYGIRILNQDLSEMIFSFIISANNNIKRIKGIVERICEALGTKTNHGYAFPTAQQMACGSTELFAKLGAGYRASYLYETANKLSDGELLAKLPNCDTPTARKLLLSLKGIGPKVADCILLFGMHRNDVCPVDTWIKKVYHNHFETGLKDNKIADYFVELFGEDSGICQQFLFYFERKYRQNEGNIVQ